MNKCPKCDEKMEKGALIERGKGTAGSTKWGTGVNQLLGTINDKKEVVSYRCTSCGFLESYAK